MRLIYLIIASIFLSACSIQGMVEKTVPEDVRADHNAHIDRLLAKDTSRIETAFKLDSNDPDVQQNLKGILDRVSNGKEIRRDYVGVNSATSISSGAGKSRDINLVTEIQTEGGFMTVTGQYALGADGVCCVLTNITVEKFESSPIRIVWETAAKIGKFVGLFFLGIVILTVLLVMRSNKKKRAAREAGLS